VDEVLADVPEVPADVAPEAAGEDVTILPDLPVADVPVGEEVQAEESRPDTFVPPEPVEDVPPVQDVGGEEAAAPDLAVDVATPGKSGGGGCASARGGALPWMPVLGLALLAGMLRARGRRRQSGLAK
jgi:hypothetical protein